MYSWITVKLKKRPTIWIFVQLLWTMCHFAPETESREELFFLEPWLGNGHNLDVTVNVGFRGKHPGYRNHCWRFESDTIRWFQFVSRRIPLPKIHSKLAGEGVPLMLAAWMRFWLLPSRVSCVLLCTSLLLLLLLCCIVLLLVNLLQVMWGLSRHLGSLTAANWVSFDFNVSYSSCWG